MSRTFLKFGRYPRLSEPSVRQMERDLGQRNFSVDCSSPNVHVRAHVLGRKPVEVSLPNGGKRSGYPVREDESRSLPEDVYVIVYPEINPRGEPIGDPIESYKVHFANKSVFSKMNHVRFPEKKKVPTYRTMKFRRLEKESDVLVFSSRADFMNELPALKQGSVFAAVLPPKKKPSVEVYEVVGGKMCTLGVFRLSE